jgi:hypothetical protein
VSPQVDMVAQRIGWGAIGDRPGSASRHHSAEDRNRLTMYSGSHNTFDAVEAGRRELERKWAN